MKKDLLIKLGIIAVIVAITGYFAFLKPVKLGLDLKGGVYVVMKAVPTEAVKEINDETMTRLVEIMDRRINAFGVTEPTIQKSENDRIILELPGIKNAQEAIDTIGKTALMEFKIVKDDGTFGETLLTGDALKKADVSYDQFGRPEIQFEMNDKGASTFAEITRSNIGKRLAITLDGVQQTAPTIQSEIPNGKGVITGQYTLEEAKKMAMLLNAGALPVKVEIMETRTIGASLGDESIKQSYKAAIVALALIAVFMIIFYMMPGFVAILSLAIYGIVVLGCLNFLDATMTLPGIAGLILSVGMAVDANVIIFARMKEELRLGSSVMASLNAGFDKAFVAIFDSNVTTLLITSVLFFLGSGPIKGFAITLAVGILASMFTAVTVTKVLLKGFILYFNIENPKLFGVRRDK